MTPDDNGSNGHSQLPVEILERQFPQLADLPPARPRRRSIWPALILFLLTVLTTLSVGAEFARSYALDQQPFTSNPNYFAMVFYPLLHPRLLLLGIPFSFTLLTILLAHELGHYFACKLHGIDASYPYFIPAPTLFGTFGAFIRIRSPITTRRALFDVGLSGPVVGFVLAVPAMAYAVAFSKIIPGSEAGAAIVFGNPLLVKAFIAIFHPGVDAASVLLHPIGRAAWAGLFLTGLNLLPVWQLDGGHVVYSLAGQYHRRISIIVAVALIIMGKLDVMWYGWGGILLILTLRFHHPPVMDRWQPLTPSRKMWALGAALIFLLCFTLRPARNTGLDPEAPPVHARLVGSTSTITAVSGISFEAQKSRQPLSTCDNAERRGDLSTN
jgi:Zn-dependent protease